MRRICFATGLALTAGSVSGQSFVNWESPHGTPLALTPNGSKLLAVNTADNRLEVFAVTAGGLSHVGSIPVGLDPVSVRAAGNTEAWVVNHVSDSVSIVDLVAFNVVDTIFTGDEPVDVVFAAGRAFVSVSQLNQVRVYDAANPSAPPVVLDIEGEDPRALATDGQTVYAAIFESGNNTAILPQTVVSSAVNPYPGDPNPPPNVGAAFDPPIAAGLPAPPDVSLIVRKDASGVWRDDNGTDWSAAVTWDLRDHDVAIIDAASLSVSYATGLMNANMALGISPGGEIVVVGTDCINEIRFEPNVAGIFVRVLAASFETAGGPDSTVDLNGHLDYSTPTVAQATRDLSIGDPRGIAWRSATRAFITGMGSSNVAVVDGALGRTGLIEVGQGPTGVVYDAAHDRAYVLNKFEGSISVIDAAGLAEETRVPFYDPTPAAITAGRPFLYDTHRTSGLGQASCASCHIDGRMDQVAWDLGDPAGDVKPFNQVCNFGLGGCEDWHPMKGPMATQTLIGIIDTEPFHWRADREGLEAFNPAFEGLLGDDAQLTALEMAQYVAFVATLTPPPNPFRNLNGTLKTSIALPPAPAGVPATGNAVTGQSLFNTGGLDVINCVTCHALPSGTNGQLTSGNLLQETQSIKIPQLRNLYEKTGFDDGSSANNRGFGFIHDGSVDTLFQFLNFSGFQFTGANANANRRHVEAFLMSFATDTHAGVGAQATVPETVGAGDGPALADVLTIGHSGATGLVVKGVVNGEQRGYAWQGGTYRSDRAAETISEAALLALAGAGTELTFTLVPAGSQTRIGIDRDEDGFFDRDELDAGSDPADPESTPDNVVEGDLNGDGSVNVADLLLLLGTWGGCPDPPAPCAGDIDDDGMVGVTDLLIVLGNWS